MSKETYAVTSYMLIISLVLIISKNVLT